MPKQTILTKEYFEKHLDKRFKENAKEIKEHVSKEVADLAAMNAPEFRRVHDEFGKVHQKIDKLVVVVDNHEKRLTRVEKAIGMPQTI